ncbi:hypothetical protein VZT92_022556 [Zoarces viviparus]|uniref:Uncharacterized protein n=1 Tax=Zoarces viviparus TaxID=48416 RepID=A0AAW1EBA9_ZOAVI
MNIARQVLNRSKLIAHHSANVNCRRRFCTSQHMMTSRQLHGLAPCRNVEYYDATTDEWTEACPLDISRSAVSCCVLSGLPNMDEYVFPRDSLSIT